MRDGADARPMGGCVVYAESAFDNRSSVLHLRLARYVEYRPGYKPCGVTS